MPSYWIKLLITTTREFCLLITQRKKTSKDGMNTILPCLYEYLFSSSDRSMIYELSTDIYGGPKDELSSA